MIRRRVIAVAGAAAIVSAAPANAAPLTADRLPPALLADCEARALPFGRYAPAISASARALIDIGAFAAEEFQSARIGFCELQRVGGPVATASCPDGVILLDEKYAGAGQAFVLQATLAHEMTHHLQHQERTTRYGPGYCASARYSADKPALEKEADAFGDKVAALFTLGRPVEIFNACDDPVSIYFEADDPVAVRGAGPAFQRVPARASSIAAERALSRSVRIFARTDPASGPAYVWQDEASAQTRFVEGRLIRLKTFRLSAPDRVESPFRLRLSCVAR